MDALPEHTRILVERLLEQYCAQICPPTARNVVLTGYRIEGCDVFIDEHQRICGVPGTRRPLTRARFRYRAQDASWSLEHPLGHGGWRRHPRHLPSRQFVELLRAFDADPLGLFWSQLDGKNLRWCSARGRCPGCEQRYAQVLGSPSLAQVHGTR